MHLEPEADALLVEDVEDRPPALREVLVAALDLGEVVGWERVDEVPDRGAGEAVDLRDAEPCRRPGRVLHPFRGPRSHALRDRRRRTPPAAGSRGGARRSGRTPPDPPGAPPIAQTPRSWRSRSSRSDRDVAVVGERLVDLEMVAPAGELEPVEAEASAFRGEVGERQVGPLAGEQGDGTGHRCSFSARDGNPRTLHCRSYDHLGCGDGACARGGVRGGGRRDSRARAAADLRVRRADGAARRAGARRLARDDRRRCRRSSGSATAPASRSSLAAPAPGCRAARCRSRRGSSSRWRA